MTKALPKTKFSNFVSQLGLEDIRQRLALIKRIEELRDQIKLAQSDQEYEIKTGGRIIKKQ